MSAIGLFGVLLSILGLYFSGATRSIGRATLFVCLLAEHITSAVVYQQYVEAFGGDALMYFNDPYGWYGYTGWGLSTVLVLNIVQTLKVWFGGTMLDYFLLFQASGFWGILFMLRTIDGLFAELNITAPPLVYAALFLPSLHFWTCAIGKDAPLFLASAAAVWSLLRFRSRAAVLIAAVILMALIRAHVALIATFSIGLAVTIARRSGIAARLALLALTGAVVGYLVVGAVAQTTAVDLTDPESVAQFLEQNSALDEASGAQESVANAALPVKVLSLLFRPLFVDAEGILGYIASVENTILLTVFLFLIWNWRVCVGLMRRVPLTAFCALFTVALTVLLALVNYNVGLGLRQRTMFLPALLTFAVSVVVVRRSRAKATGPIQAPLAAPLLAGSALSSK